MNRILIIRGGAIGDFILTLPAMRGLREAYPEAHVEVLGYKHIAALAEKRFYAGAVRSIEYAPLAAFFGRGAELPDDLANYFAGFDLIISYLYDPDGIFATNLRRCGVEDLIIGRSKLEEDAPAAQQLARAMRELDVEISDFAPRVFPSREDRQLAAEFLRGLPEPVVALHPGSGSAAKNWPLENWLTFGSDLLGRDDFGGSILVVGGEADEAQLRELQSAWPHARVRFARNLPLPQLAAALERTIFIGHDSGISHLAAAAGANCIVLFGPSDPAIWAPRNNNVQIISAPNGDLRQLNVDLVWRALDQELMRIGIRT